MDFFLVLVCIRYKENQTRVCIFWRPSVLELVSIATIVGSTVRDQHDMRSPLTFSEVLLNCLSDLSQVWFVRYISDLEWFALGFFCKVMEKQGILFDVWWTSAVKSSSHCPDMGGIFLQIFSTAMGSIMMYTHLFFVLLRVVSNFNIIKTDTFGACWAVFPFL